MKKLTLFILTIFTVATLFAAARPSLDGRAVVADSGTMPRGLFARTVGYLPGDSVTVTNPATGSAVDVLVLGAIDPSEGVAILLSPEAAEGLRIKPNSNVQVKLTKRSGSLDENANGSAVLSEEEEEKPQPKVEMPTVTVPDAVATAVPKVTPAPVVENAPAPLPALTPVVVPAAEDKKTEETFEETPVVAEKIEENPAVAEKAGSDVVEEIPVPAENTPAYEEIPVVADKTEDGPVLSKVEPVMDKTEEEEVQPDTVYEILPPLPDGERTYGKQKVVVIEGTEPDYIEETRVEKTPSVVENEEPVYVAETPVEQEVVSEEVVAREPVAEEAVTEEAVSESVIAEEPVTVEPVSEEIAAEPVVEETLAEAVTDEELPAGIETEPVVVAEEKPAVSEELTDAYQPIVLVPAEPNPPVSEEKPAAQSAPVVVGTGVDGAAEKEIVPVKETAPQVVIENKWTNYVVPSVKNLRKGSYYVQVASLGNTDNIKNFIDKYSAKYPVVLVQNSSKNSYQVMVGPLNIDEYGAVDEKFRAHGFKDAFVRKIK